MSKILTKAQIVEQLSAVGIKITKAQQKKTSHADLLAQLEAAKAKVVPIRGKKRATVDVDAGSPDADVKPERRSAGITIAPGAELKPVREGSKVAAMIAVLERPQGATIDDLVTATGWRDAATAKTGLYWDLRQKGLGVRTEHHDNGVKTYHLVLPKGVKRVAYVKAPAVKAAANRSK